MFIWIYYIFWGIESGPKISKHFQHHVLMSDTCIYPYFFQKFHCIARSMYLISCILFKYIIVSFIFRCLRNGSKLIAIHAGKYYKRENGLALGPGCFVKGLEYSAQCSAEIVGKPSKEFFLAALSDISPEEAVMIGDVSFLWTWFLDLFQKKLRLQGKSIPKNLYLFCEQFTRRTNAVLIV